MMFYLLEALYTYVEPMLPQRWISAIIAYASTNRSERGIEPETSPDSSDWQH